MLQYFARWNQWLGRRMFFVVLSALLSGFLLPLPHSPALGTAAVALFAYMTFITALDTSFKDFFHILSVPVLPCGCGHGDHPQQSHHGLTSVSSITATRARATSPRTITEVQMIEVTPMLTRLGFLIGASIPNGELISLSV